MPNDFRPSESWDRVAAELRACREAQRKAWGDIDNGLVGRYLTGDLTPDESRRVEAALKDHPDLQLLTDVVREVMGDHAAEPAILPFSPKRSKPRTPGLARYRAVLAAASVLIVVGIPVAGFLTLTPPDRASGPVAWHEDKVSDSIESAPPTPPPHPEPNPLALGTTRSGPGSRLPGDAPSVPQIQSLSEVDVLLEEGRRDLARQQYEQAEVAFRKASSLLQKTTDARARADVVTLQQKVAELEQTANRMMVARKQYSLAMQEAGRALAAQRYDRAVDQFQAALQYQPADRAALDGLNRVQEHLATTKAVSPEPPPTVSPAAAQPNPETEALGKATAALRTFSPVAGHVTETLRKWCERWQVRGKK